MSKPHTKIQRSIKTKITLTALATVTLLIITIFSVQFLYVHKLLKNSVLEQQSRLVTEIANQLNGRIEMAQRQLSLLAKDVGKADLHNTASVQSILDREEDARLSFDNGFLVVGLDGRIITESPVRSERIGKDMRFRSYVSETLRTGKSYMSEPYKAGIPPYLPVVTFAEPIKNSKGEIVGILAGRHSLGSGHFLTSVTSAQLGTSGYLYILHGRTILMHPEINRILEVVPEGKNRGIDQAVKGVEGSFENYNSRGLRMLSSFKRVGKTEWILGANTPYEVAFKPLQMVAIKSLILILTGIFITIFVIFMVLRRLISPIEALTAHINDVYHTQKKWNSIVINTGDEIECLATAFNNMMAEVQEANQTIVESNQFIENIINSASSPIFVIDRTHKVLFWNKSLEAMSGCSADKMKQTDLQWSAFYQTKRATLADMIVDGQDEFIGMYQAVRCSKYADGGLQAEGWYEFNGQKRYLRFEAAPVMDSAGDVLAAVETFEDITERVLLEEAQHKLLRVVEQSPVTIVITNLDGIIEYVNPKFSQTTGYSAAEAIGQHTRLLKSGEMSKEGYAGLWKTISSGKEWHDELHNKRKDGSLYWEFASISPMFDKNGVITGYLAVKEDISSRKETEANLIHYRQELENKHAELKQVFTLVENAKHEWEETLDHLRDFVILTDNNHNIRRYNKLLAEMSGKPVNELIGEDWRSLLTDAGFTFITFNGVSGEIFHKRSGRSYDLNIFDIQEDGALSGHVISINDTTELRLAGSELKKAYAELKDAQMQIFQQEKMASIGQLAAGVAHEINNPMGFISSNLGTLNKYIDRLSEYIAAGEQAISTCGDNVEASRLHDLRKRLKIEYITDDARQLIAESQDGAGRVRRIVQDLKSFSRVDQAEKGLINLNEALETTINIAWNEIKYIAVLNREFGDIPEILCFPQQLNQVFLNLLVNAAHAMGETQGTITVRTWCEKECVFVSVADTGCGIPEEIRQRIFEPFFTTKEVGKGTGLGLSISYEIIRKHGGEIKVESEVGQGTTFIVILPVEGPKEQDEQVLSG